MTHESGLTSGPRLLNVATANPGSKYTQQDLLKLFGVTNEKIAGLFTNSHIASRYLCLPEPGEAGLIPEETSLELWQKHREQALATGRKAIETILKRLNMNLTEIDYLACVTSTGFLCPSLTAHFIKELGLRRDVHRIDIVGMGCNAGLNGMQPLVNYCRQYPDRHALLVCVEICSAAYVFDMTMRTAVVNSLFGDGCAVAVFGTRPDYDPALGPEMLGFESYIIPEQIDAMRFDFDGNKNSFFLDREIPFVLGEHAARPVVTLLDRFGLKIQDVSHWVIHTGGRKVLNAVKQCLNISDHDIRHSISVLRDLGNQSSGSFLFSFERLMEERVARRGDYLLMMTMGPGSTIECGLARF